MATIDERVAFVEGRVGQHSQMIESIRQAIVTLDQRMVALETRLDRLEARMDQRFTAIDVRFTELDEKMSRHFLGILGVQMTMFVAMIATLLTAFLARR